MHHRPVLATLGVLLVAALAATLYVGAVWYGWLGTVRQDGIFVAQPVPAAEIGKRSTAQAAAANAIGQSGVKQILFGDLHVHTTFSEDAFYMSLSLQQGEGALPPADACDYARFCSALDFWSITDHAESLTPRKWGLIKESIRQCNAISGAPDNPDTAAFLGWEWTQTSASPQQAYGHKNVIFLDTADAEVPSRPIAAQSRHFYFVRAPLPAARLYRLVRTDPSNRQRYYDVHAGVLENAAVEICPAGVDVRDLPAECAEVAVTAGELFQKLDQWGFNSMVIPHGNAWGANTPLGARWDTQLLGGNHDPKRQRLIEVYSGHGNSEEYRPWRQAVVAADGQLDCPEPVAGFSPACWRAGEIIRSRCEAAGLAIEECAGRDLEARQNYVRAGLVGHQTVPGSRAQDWLDAGQCTDCFLPAYKYIPTGSAQYALAIRNFDAAGAPAELRFGFIGSSDNHRARPGTGFKEMFRRTFADASGPIDPELSRIFMGEPPAPTLESVSISQGDRFSGGLEYERAASFLYTGGLVAAHSAGRDRQSIWQALQRREVYATSGPRILLWFDLVDDGTISELPMGSEIVRSQNPKFRVRAVGSLKQKPGCPDYSFSGLGAEDVERLCRGECYHPSDERLSISRIEVVRIRPQTYANEPVTPLVEDAWQVLDCAPDPNGCAVEFEDPDFAKDGRDTVYYVRAIQEPTPAVNGDPVACEERDDDGRCVRVRLCAGGYPTDPADDCLSDVEERAWSSPIFVDYGPEQSNPT